MLQVRPRFGAVMLALAAGGAAVSMPREARATVGGGLGGPFFSMFLYNVCDPLGGTIFRCHHAGLRLDPSALVASGDVTQIRVVIDYDPPGPNFFFEPALSGPLGPFSVGGSAPPATPGVGTQPLPVFTSFPDSPGAPLPGSTLTVTDAASAVTVDYRLAAPVNVATETNFFLLTFGYITPFVIDASLSTVTYFTTAEPGADFTQLSALCTSGPPLFETCGSTTPAVSVFVDLKTVPEPAPLALLGPGLALAAAGRRRRPALGAAR